jgi:MFS transporter, DHA3 family, macrolide efflux protein
MSILQAKTPPDLQGRVFAVVGQLLMIATPISFLITGPLVDQTLEPAVRTPTWNAFAPLVGDQAGAGMRLVLFAVGVIILLTTAAVYALPALRHMEANLPDYEAETADEASLGVQNP